MTKVLQCLRYGLVRRDDAASTIRSDAQIVDAFREHTRGTARLDRTRPAPTLPPVRPRGSSSGDRDRGHATKRLNIAPFRPSHCSEQPAEMCLLHRDAIKVALSRAAVERVHIRRWPRDDPQRLDSAGAGKTGDVLLRNKSPFRHGR